MDSAIRGAWVNQTGSLTVIHRFDEDLGCGTWMYADNKGRINITRYETSEGFFGNQIMFKDDHGNISGKLKYKFIEKNILRMDGIDYRRATYEEEDFLLQNVFPSKS